MEFVNPRKERITKHFYAVTHMALLDAPGGRVIWEGSALPPVFPDPDADTGPPGVGQQLLDAAAGRVSPAVLAAGGAVLLLAVGGVTLILLRRPRRAKAKKVTRRPRDEDDAT